MNSLVIGLVVSTIAYLVASFCIKRYLDGIGVAKSMPRSLATFVLAATVAYLVAFIIDWIGGAFAASAQSEIAVVERERISGRAFGTSAPASHRLNLTLVNIEGSGWTRERAVAALHEAAAIFGQCGVAVADAEWITLSAPPRFLYFSTPVARELARLYPVRRPAVYLVRDTRNLPAFDAEAIGRGNSRSRPELADTVWITASVRDTGIVLAHELAHVLMDGGEHSEEPGNLMREETEAMSTALSAAQCARLRDTGSGNGLIKSVQQQS